MALGFAQAATADEFDDALALWQIADEAYRPVTRTLATAPFVHRKVLRLEPGSLEHGWVSNHQCHRDFPVFPVVEIGFRAGTVRKLRIVEQGELGDARVRPSSIRLEQTRGDSRLCFTSENEIVEHDATTDEYRVTVGPYYLKLFDGFFPLDVDLTLAYPEASMTYLGMEPEGLEGATLTRQHGTLRFRALFEGRLQLVFRFRRT